MPILAVLALAASVQEFKYEPWESWNAYREGSSVEFEFEASGMKFTQAKEIKSKAEKRIVLKTVTKLDIGGNLQETAGEENIDRPEGAGAEGNCPLCGKPSKEHKDQGKWSEEKVKVGDKELACRKWESPAKYCNGNDMPRTMIWYSTEVPGHLVKMEMPSMKMTLLKFDARK